VSSDPVRALLPDLLTVEETQTRLGIGRTTVFTLIRSGVLASVLHNRRRMVSAASVERYVTARAAALEAAIAKQVF
jgi:hypothetical protein